MREIDELTDRGFKVKVRHLRLAEPKIAFGETEEELRELITWMRDPQTLFKLREMGYDPSPTGGITQVRVEDDAGIVVYTDEVRVSNWDHYNKKRGIAVLLGRARKNTGIYDLNPPSEQTVH